MNINTNLFNFKKKHKNKKNQILFHKANCPNNKTIENIIDNFLFKKNSFIFESVEKRRIRGRYTIIGADPDKIWEFNKKKIYIIENNTKKIIKASPYKYLKSLIEDFNFPLPKKIPPLCSLLVGYFSYDIIRYIEKVILNNLNDNKTLKDEILEQIYSHPEKKIIAAYDLNFTESFLIYIDKVVNASIKDAPNEYEEYEKLSRVRISNALFNTYDKYLKNKYEIDINYNALKTVKNYFD